MQMGGVDHQIGPVANGSDQFAFKANAVGHGTIHGQRMPPAGLGKAADEDFVITVQKQDRGGQVLARGKLVDLGNEIRGREVARADIETNGDGPSASRRLLESRAEQLGQQR